MDRGKFDAPVMASKLKTLLQGQRIDVILSSTSQRTRETLVPFAKAFEIDSMHIIYDPKLYLADSEYLLDALFQVPDEFDSILLFAHNPGMTDLANEVSSSPIENVPTSGIFKVEFQTDFWTDVNLGCSKMGFFIYPKMYK